MTPQDSPSQPAFLDCRPLCCVTCVNTQPPTGCLVINAMISWDLTQLGFNTLLMGLYCL